jgi:hypothetical protein
VTAIFIERKLDIPEKTNKNFYNLFDKHGYIMLYSASLHRLKPFWYVNSTTAEPLPSENSNHSSQKK